MTETCPILGLLGLRAGLLGGTPREPVPLLTERLYWDMRGEAAEGVADGGPLGL